MKKKMDSLQALKAIACLIVFMNHSGIKIAGVGAISVFFITSGFTMVYSYIDRPEKVPAGFLSSLSYSVKRVGKLYPLYLICMLPVLALDLWSLCGNYSTEFALSILKKLIASLLLIQSWIPDSEYALAFNGVAWFLSTAMFLYFCFPFVLRLVKKDFCRKHCPLLILLLTLLPLALGFAVAPMESFLSGHGLIPADGKFAYWFTYIFPPFRLFDFTIGCLIAIFFLDMKERSIRIPAAALDTVSALLWISASYIYLYSDSFLAGEAFKYTLLFIPAAASSVFCFALDQSFFPKLLTNKFMLFIGRISPDFFLLHQNIIRFSIMFLTMASIPFSTVKLIIPLFCFIITVAACLIWEKLYDELKHRIKR